MIFLSKLQSTTWLYRADPRFALNQWEMLLLCNCNDVSHCNQPWVYTIVFTLLILFIEIYWQQRSFMLPGLTNYKHSSLSLVEGDSDFTATSGLFYLRDWLLWFQLKNHSIETVPWFSFLLQNSALWDIRLMALWDLLGYPFLTTSFKSSLQESTWFYIDVSKQGSYHAYDNF